MSPSGSVKGRLIVKVDLGNGEAPIALVTQAASALPELTQQDINRDGTVFELPLATYDVTEVLISGLASVATKLTAPIDDKLKQSVANLEKGKYNATAKKSGATIAITGPAGAETVVFVAPSDWAAGDKYTYNGTPLTLATLTGEPVEDAWKSGSPIQFFIQGNKAFFKAGGGSKIPSDLAPLCPNFVVERKGTKVKISADKIQLNSLTSMVSGGVWAWGKTRPTKPTGENTKQWSRAALITTGKPYDGLYLGDVTASDAVNEILLWLPEKIGGKTVLSPFIILSTDYLGGVYVLRKETVPDITVGKWNAAYYDGSILDTTITGTYLNSILDKSVTNKLVACDLPIQGAASQYETTVKIRRKAWALSYSECYAGTVDGTKMSYFTGNPRRATNTQYWLRSRGDGSGVNNIRYVDTSGAVNIVGSSNYSFGIRPAFVLPKDFQIQQRPDGSYTVWNEMGLMKLGDIKPSTSSEATRVNIKETAGCFWFDYLTSNYNDTKRGLLFREECLPDVANTNVNYQYSQNYQKITEWEAALPKTLRNLIQEVQIKYKNGNSVSTLQEKAFALSHDELFSDFSLGTGTTFQFFELANNRIRKKSGSATTYWLRDAGSDTMVYYVDGAGNWRSDYTGKGHQVVPAFTLPLTAPIRQLADGTYDLVPDDPALATQSISTMAAAGTPVQLKDIPVSTAGNAVTLKIPETSGEQDYIYLVNGYEGSSAGLLERFNVYAQSQFGNVSLNKYNGSNVDQTCQNFANTELSDSVKNFLVEIVVPTMIDTGLVNRTAFVLSGIERGWGGTSQNEGSKIPYFSDNASRIKNYNSSPAKYWTRQYNGPGQVITVNTDGSILDTDSQGRPASSVSLGVPISISVSLDAWFIDNGDGTYTFVGDEPAPTEQPLEIEIDWPESDSLIARQWVYNNKGQYQTMLLGGIASTEDETLPEPDPVFGNNTPEQIKSAITQGIYKDLWSIGDEITIFADDGNYDFEIADFDHDPVSGESRTAPITLALKNLMSTPQKMNTGSFNTGSYAASLLHDYLTDTVYNSLSDEWKSIILSVDKKTSAGRSSTSIQTDSLNLFPFSEIELTGLSSNTVAGEGKQYPIFATASDRIKKMSNGTGSVNAWWTRSPQKSNNQNFIIVLGSGDTAANNAGGTYGVCFGFCIG